MANSFPETARAPFAFGLALILVCAAGDAAAQQSPLADLDFGVNTALPITLDADSSEFDRRNNKLKFRGLRITQGALAIKADEAQASRLDFENSLWVFTGNVVIESEAATAWCDTAEMRFSDYDLESAVLFGEPVRFEQTPGEDGGMTRGRANVMEYDVAGGVIRMIDDAWLSDGSNEVSGARISYDLVKDFVIADADESGQIRMKINPPERAGAEGLPD